MALIDLSGGRINAHSSENLPAGCANLQPIALNFTLHCMKMRIQKCHNQNPLEPRALDLWWLRFFSANNQMVTITNCQSCKRKQATSNKQQVNEQHVTSNIPIRIRIKPCI
jgi:hypothetical protein